MGRPDAVVVLDMDGVLLDLPVDIEALRARIREDFTAAGIAGGFRPLLASIEGAVTEVGRRDGEEAERLRLAAWERIDRVEGEAAQGARARPGVGRFFARASGTPLALYTNTLEEAAIAALRAAGIDPGAFAAIRGRRGAGTLKPSGAPIAEAVRAAGGDRIRRVVMVGDHPYDMASLREAEALLGGELGARAPAAIALGMRRDAAADARLEAAGADFLCADLDEVAALAFAAPFAASLSIVLLAYDEERSIAAAIGDARRFCALYAPDYEIVVVDDGSRDGTAAAAERADRGDVRLVRHPENRGMGAALRSGYRAAAKEYVAHLPADRQVRPQALAALLPHVGPCRVPVSSYAAPPSGPRRAALSKAFRALLRGVGGLEVDFAGTYVFPRALLAAAEPPDAAASPTFLYSFQLLEGLRRAGCDFPRAAIHPFLRAAGASREATARRIAKVAFEIARCRAASIRRGGRR